MAIMVLSWFDLAEASRMTSKYGVFVVAFVVVLARPGSGGDHNLRFAPSERLLPAEDAPYGDGQVLFPSVECLTPAVTPQGKLRLRVRLHWKGFAIDAVNPFLDPMLEGVGQLAVFDEEGLYRGNLIGWQATPYLTPITATRSNPVQVRWDKGAGVTGRTVVTQPLVQPEEGERFALKEGRYKAQLIVYDRIFGGKALLNGSPTVVCRSEPVRFEIRGDASSELMDQDKQHHTLVEFRFVGDPLRFEIENTGECLEEIYDPWLANYERLGEAGAYQFKWHVADGSEFVHAVLPRGIPNRGMWVKMPPGGFAGRDVPFKPTGKSLMDGHAELTAVVLTGALAKHAFPEREAPWDFVHCTEVMTRSKPAQYVAPNWKAD
ncbi:hypothetical protein AYO47_01260 [Planctomyces sp. SCGC AG-212-M04]|nr:hypothetical protein AYO47_01260 [Planctomyces sp. SCGC AG-212-M04]